MSELTREEREAIRADIAVYRGAPPSDFVEDEWVGRAERLLAALEAAERERDELRATLGDERHWITLDENGWAIQHPLRCRPDMTQCDVHAAVMADPPDWGTYPHGRWEITLSDEHDGLYAVHTRVRVREEEQ